jgi:hypothetical protein
MQQCRVAAVQMLGQALKTLQNFKERFTAKAVIHSPLAKFVPRQNVTFPGGPVMHDFEFRERLRRPPHHSR